MRPSMGEVPTLRQMMKISATRPIVAKRVVLGQVLPETVERGWLVKVVPFE